MMGRFGNNGAGVLQNRRRFLQSASGALAGGYLSRLATAQSIGVTKGAVLKASLAFDSTAQRCTVPRNFTGLSYESAQLANPDFFSRENESLVRIFRELSPRGVLRLGGGTSEFTSYSETAPVGPPPFEVFGPDTSKTAKKGTTTSALALRNLREFLDATGWTCLYGLNLGQGTKENAVAEAEAAHRILGSRLMALQIGNEPDSFRKRYRPASYSPEDFIREWVAFHDAIVARVPGAKFAGPDISNKLEFLTAFAEEARKHPDVILLTAHYYAMGPAGRPDATIENLLSADPKSATLKWTAVPVVQDACRTARLPFRVSEMNSCWNGGQPGVSDVFASALWCADVMLHFASLGWSGVNLHGGGNGIYAPIVGSPSAGFTLRPEFFGMQFAQHFAGRVMFKTELDCANDRLTAYAAEAEGAKGVEQIAVINKSDTPVELTVTGVAPAERWRSLRLVAPAIDARTGVKLEEGRSVRLGEGTWLVAPYSAMLWTANG